MPDSKLVVEMISLFNLMNVLVCECVHMCTHRDIFILICIYVFMCEYCIYVHMYVHIGVCIYMSGYIWSYIYVDWAAKGWKK